MNENGQIRIELMDIFDDISSKIDDGTYLKAVNLLAKIETRTVVNLKYSDFMDILDAYPTRYGLNIASEDFMVSRPGLVFPILTSEEKQFLIEKYMESNSWRFLINEEDTFILNQETMRFVSRSSRLGRRITKLCNIEQYPEMYTVNPRTGRLVLRRV